jgi:ribosomal protein S18 acetylase RimI-like enzyme
VPGQALLGELALDDVLRRDAGVVHAGQPERVVPLHPAAPDQDVLDGVVERVADVQRAGDVRRRDHDAVRLGVLLARGREVAALDPAVVEGSFDVGGDERRGELVLRCTHAGSLETAFGHDARVTDTFTFRAATADDAAFLDEMLLEAFNWAPDRAAMTLGQIRSDPALAKYAAPWPAAGELGVVAESLAGDPAGAAWLRYFPATNPGYGFVAEDVPELTLAVAPDWRGMGLGRLLLDEVATAARTAGIERISLSVERANHAAKLYASAGYEVVGGDADADTMVKTL